jgi:formate/nitrite transporter
MLNQKELAEYCCEVGLKKVSQGFWKTFVSANLAGLFIALGYYGYLVLVNGDNLGSVKFFGAAVFSVGLVIILIAGGDLFTGNCLVTMGAFNKKYSYKKVIRNLSIVFLGNFIGALFIVALLYFSSSYTINADVIINASKTKLEYNFIEAIFNGILCNIIVAVAVYISYASKSISGKVIAAMLPVILFVIVGFEHSVANMFIHFMAKALGSGATIDSILIMNLLPVTIGNIIGGTIIVPGAYYFIHLTNA